MGRNKSKFIRKDSATKSVTDCSSKFYKGQYYRLVKGGPAIFQDLLDIRRENSLLRTPDILPISVRQNDGRDDFERYLRCVENKSWKEKYEAIKLRLEIANIDLNHLKNENLYLANLDADNIPVEVPQT